MCKEKVGMGKVIFGMALSLDGYVNDPEGSVGRLYTDLAGLAETEVMQDAIRTTGAVVMGRRSYEMASDPDEYADSYEFQAPLFVITHHPPTKMPKQNDNLTFTFVTDGIESAIMQAKAAAGDKNVMIVGGVDVAHQAIKAGLIDELQITLVPVLLGGGLKLFDNLQPDALKLERTSLIASPDNRTDITYRVLK
jgi:dihydrofolate reductase